MNRAVFLDIKRSGQILEVDLTVVDTYLVSSIDQDHIIGRPTVYIAKDIYSQMIVGVHMDLGEPSWTGIILALKNTVEDKVEFCRKFTVDILKNEWPNSFSPESFLVGKLDIEDYQYDNLAKLGIGVIIKPQWPSSKGLVERQFSLLNSKINYECKKKVGLKKEKVSDLDSLLTLEEFRKVVLHWVLQYNNQVLNSCPSEF